MATHAYMHTAQSKRAQFAPPPHHPLILANALPQVPVVDFAQQCMIAQILVTRQEKEVARLEQAVRDSVSNPDEVT